MYKVKLNEFIYKLLKKVSNKSKLKNYGKKTKYFSNVIGNFQFKY